MRFAHRFVVVLALLCVAPFAFAQDHPEGSEHQMTPPPPPQDAVLDARVGNWTGTGTMMGMPMTDTVRNEWILGHQFFRSTSTTTMTMPDGSSMSFDMEMTQKPDGAGNFTGIYMDAWGMQGEFTGRVENGQVITEWTDPMHGSQNRAVDTNNPDGGWTMTFYTMGPDGNWVDSGSVIYTRAP